MLICLTNVEKCKSGKALSVNERKGVNQITVTGELKKIDEYEQVIILTDDAKIAIDAILNIESEIFSVLE